MGQHSPSRVRASSVNLNLNPPDVGQVLGLDLWNSTELPARSRAEVEEWWEHKVIGPGLPQLETDGPGRGSGASDPARGHDHDSVARAWFQVEAARTVPSL
eukprot:2531172-Rhodomonas_salina.1